MKKGQSDVNIHIAFRFHVNFYHSYRGDTPDELGFGKDIRIIRKIIKLLDRYNSENIPVCGTWDIENYYSLEKIMPKYCPDIIESWKRRVVEGHDEIELMSYNNGLLSCQNAREFEEAVKMAETNSAGSGLKDIFGSFAPVVRPQEMMYTPSFLKLYTHYGIEALSLYYSSIPFNCFSTFIPPLPPHRRYNPMKLTYPGIEESLVLIPAYNIGDLVDNLSLLKWVRRMRKNQLNMEKQMDFFTFNRYGCRR